MSNSSRRSDQDYMLALALQQEDASSASRLTPPAPSAHHAAPVDDEVVARALQQEEQALLEQHPRTNSAAPTRAMRGQGMAFREDENRGAYGDRSGLQDRDRWVLDVLGYYCSNTHRS